MDGLEKAEGCLQKLQALQAEHEKVVLAMVQISDHLPDLKKKVMSHLRANYARAFDETKKNAGMDTLLLWAGKDMETPTDYDQYVYWHERFEEMKRISDAYLGNISSVQSRLSFFRNL